MFYSLIEFNFQCCFTCGKHFIPYDFLCACHSRLNSHLDSEWAENNQGFGLFMSVFVLCVNTRISSFSIVEHLVTRFLNNEELGFGFLKATNLQVISNYPNIFQKWCMIGTFFIWEWCLLYFHMEFNWYLWLDVRNIIASYLECRIILCQLCVLTTRPGWEEVLLLQTRFG